MLVPKRIPDRRRAWIGLLVAILAGAVAAAAILGYITSLILKAASDLNQ